MTVELKDVSLVPSSCFNCWFMMIGIAFSLGSREARGWAGMTLFGLQPRSPQPRSAAHQHQLSLLVVATLFLSLCQEQGQVFSLSGVKEGEDSPLNPRRTGALLSPPQF